MRTPHEVLGVKAGASPAELRAAYRKRVQATHPDKGGDEAQFREVSEAYKCILQEAGVDEEEAATLVATTMISILESDRTDTNEVVDMSRKQLLIRQETVRQGIQNIQRLISQAEELLKTGGVHDKVKVQLRCLQDEMRARLLRQRDMDRRYARALRLMPDKPRCPDCGIHLAHSGAACTSCHPPPGYDRATAREVR